MQTRYILTAIIAFALVALVLHQPRQYQNSLQQSKTTKKIVNPNVGADWSQYGDIIYFQQDFSTSAQSKVSYKLSCPEGFSVLSGHCFSQNRVGRSLIGSSASSDKYVCNFDFSNTGTEETQYVTVSAVCKNNTNPILQEQVQDVVSSKTTVYAICPEGYTATGGSCDFDSSVSGNSLLGGKLDGGYYGCVVNFAQASPITVTALCHKHDGLSQVTAAKKNVQNTCTSSLGYVVGGECAPRTSSEQRIAGTLVDIRRGFWCFTEFSDQNLNVDMTYVCIEQ